MKIYFAGSAGGSGHIAEERKRQWLKNINRRLISFYYLETGGENMKEEKRQKIELFIDSGAFSAKSQGVTISIRDYIRFIKENEDIITVYANLDVIGNAKLTWVNQKIMEKEGLHPLPVYHLEDTEEYLHKCINEYEYFCLGGMARGYTTFDRTNFLDRCFKIICDTPNSLPKCKVHGFGLTSLPLMLRYPWYSVDSTSWVVTGRMGSVFIPRYVNEKWIYDEKSWKVVVSNKNPTTKEAGRHYTTMQPDDQEIFFSYISEKGYKLGISEFKKVKRTHTLADNERWSEKIPEDKSSQRELEIVIESGISNEYQLRDEMNIIYFLDLEKSMPEWPWPFKTNTRRFNLQPKTNENEKR